MDFHLAVVADFADHVRGDIIADADAIKSALADHAEKVVRIFAHLSPFQHDDAVGDVIPQTGA